MAAEAVHLADYVPLAVEGDGIEMRRTDRSRSTRR
jgi:hypothetical protein